MEESQQHLIGNALINFIDAYNAEVEKNRIHVKTNRSNLPPIKENLRYTAIVKALKDRCDTLDVDWFIENLSLLRIWGTFERIEDAEFVEQAFKLLNIAIPEFVYDRLEMIKLRAKHVEKLAEELFRWKETEFTAFDKEIQMDLDENTSTKAGKIRHLEHRIREKETEIKECIKEVDKEYGYNIKNILTIHGADKVKLNNFFFECEMSKKNAKEFFRLNGILSLYINKINQLCALQDHKRHYDKTSSGEKGFVRKIDPLTLLDQAVKKSFLEIEAKVTGGTGKFPSNLRCAAFCEMAYYAGYIEPSANNQIRMNEFAENRYETNIMIPLKSGDRARHRNNTVDGMRSLNSYFPKNLVDKVKLRLEKKLK